MKTPLNHVDYPLILNIQIRLHLQVRAFGFWPKILIRLLWDFRDQSEEANEQPCA